MEDPREVNEMLYSELTSGSADGLHALLNTGSAGADDLVLEGTPALCLASELGLTEKAAVLLQAGADVACEGQAGKPVHYAAVGGSVPMLALLAKAGADLGDLALSGGYTPLYVAALHANTLVVRSLLRSTPGDSVAARMANGATALHGGAMSGDATIVQLLLDAGADPRAITDKGHTPHDYAALSFPEHNHLLALLDPQNPTHAPPASPQTRPGSANRSRSGKEGPDQRYADAARIASGDAAAVGELKFKYRPPQVLEEARARKRAAYEARLARESPAAFFALRAADKHESKEKGSPAQELHQRSRQGRRRQKGRDGAGRANTVMARVHQRAQDADAKVSHIRFPSTREYLEGTSAREATEAQLLAVRELKEAAAAELAAVETEAGSVRAAQAAIEADLDALREHDAALEAQGREAGADAKRARQEAEAWRDAQEDERAAHELELSKRRKELLHKWSVQKAAIDRELQGESWSSDLELRKHLEARQEAHTRHLQHVIAESEAAFSIRKAQRDAEDDLARARAREKRQEAANAARFRKATVEASLSHEARLEVELSEARRQHQAEAAALKRRIRQLEMRKKNSDRISTVQKRRVVAEQKRKDQLRDTLDNQDARTTANIIRLEQERLAARIAKTEAKATLNNEKIERMNVTTAAEVAAEDSLTPKKAEMHQAQADAARAAWAHILDQEAASFEAAKLRLIAKIRTEQDFSHELAELEALEDRAAARLARPIVFAPPSSGPDGVSSSVPGTPGGGPVDHKRTLGEQEKAAARLAVPRVPYTRADEPGMIGTLSETASPQRRRVPNTKKRRKRNWEAEREARLKSGYKRVPNDGETINEQGGGGGGGGGGKGDGNVRGFASASARDLVARSAAVSSLAKSNRRAQSAKIHLPDTSFVTVPWQPKLVLADLISSLVKRYGLEAQAEELLPGVLTRDVLPSSVLDRFVLVEGCAYETDIPGLTVNAVMSALSHSSRVFTLQDRSLLVALSAAERAKGKSPEYVRKVARRAAARLAKTKRRKPAGSESESTDRNRDRMSSRARAAAHQRETIRRLARSTGGQSAAPSPAVSKRGAASATRTGTSGRKKKRDWEAEYAARQARERARKLKQSQQQGQQGQSMRSSRNTTLRGSDSRAEWGYEYEYEYVPVSGGSGGPGPGGVDAGGVDAAGADAAYADADADADADVDADAYVDADADTDESDEEEQGSSESEGAVRGLRINTSRTATLVDEDGLCSVPSDEDDEHELLASPVSGGGFSPAIVATGIGRVAAGGDGGSDDDDDDGGAQEEEEEEKDEEEDGVMLTPPRRNRAMSTTAELFDAHAFSSPTLVSTSKSYARPSYRPVSKGRPVEGPPFATGGDGVAVEAVIEEEIVSWTPVRIKSKKNDGMVHSLRFERVRRIVVHVASESGAPVALLGAYVNSGKEVNTRRLIELREVAGLPGVYGWDVRLDKRMFGGVSAKGERKVFTLVVDVSIEGIARPIRVSKVFVAKVYSTNERFTFRSIPSVGASFRGEPSYDDLVEGGHQSRLAVVRTSAPTSPTPQEI